MEQTKTSNPFTICLIVTIISVVGVVISLAFKNPLWILFFMLPALGYEAIRTEEGASTKFSSVLLLGLTILEIGLIIFGINYDLAQFFGTTEKYVAGYTVPLGDIKVFGPLLTAILSTILVFRTYGTYTKWLSVVIAIGSLTTVYLVSPSFFQQALKLIINGFLNRVY